MKLTFRIQRPTDKCESRIKDPQIRARIRSQQKYTSLSYTLFGGMEPTIAGLAAIISYYI